MIGMQNVMEDVQQAMLGELRQGVVVRKVARKYGVTYPQVYRLARRNNIAMKRGRQFGDTDLDAQARTLAIVEELKRNDNMADVARTYGVSREWVRQIGLRYGVAVNNSKAFLKAENLKLVAPILEHIKTGLCNRCGAEPIAPANKLHLCEQCTTRRRMIGVALSRLHNYVQTGATRSLNQATWTIRTYGITVEELRTY